MYCPDNVVNACGIEDAAGAESSVSTAGACAHGINPGTFTSTVERIYPPYKPPT